MQSIISHAVRCRNQRTDVCDAKIEMWSEPQDITVSPGGTAQFPCSVTGTSVPPLWIIGNEMFPVDRLPPRHSYSNQVLTVGDVQVSDSGRTYQCSYMTPQSRTATLTVLQIGGKLNFNLRYS